MKKIIILFVVLLLILIGGIISINYFMNSKEVSFILEKEKYEVVILNDKEKQVTSVNTSGIVRLEKGEYSYTVNGADYNNSPQYFTVTDDMKITIKPQYTKEYLARILETEDQAIRSVIQATYQTKPAFTIQTLAIYDDGTWAAGTFTQIADRRALPDFYRFVLHKNVDTKEWDVIIPPTIAINKDSYKDIPTDILYSLYSS